MKVLITGANRGLGLEFVRQLSEAGHTVIACCRKPEASDELKQLCEGHPDTLVTMTLDVTDDDSVTSARQWVKSKVDNLDLLINNAGIKTTDPNLADFDAQRAMSVFDVNTLGPLRVTKAFASLLEASEQPKLINISSQLGSMARRGEGGSYSYNASKAALNMLSFKLADDPELAKTIVTSVHPGWVSTDMGGQSAPVTPPESVKGLLRVIDELTPEDNGKFLTYSGETHPW